MESIHSVSQLQSDLQEKVDQLKIAVDFNVQLEEDNKRLRTENDALRRRMTTAIKRVDEIQAYGFNLTKAANSLQSVIDQLLPTLNLSVLFEEANDSAQTSSPPFDRSTFQVTHIHQKRDGSVAIVENDQTANNGTSDRQTVVATGSGANDIAENRGETIANKMQPIVVLEPCDDGPNSKNGNSADENPNQLNSSVDAMDVGTVTVPGEPSKNGATSADLMKNNSATSDADGNQSQKDTFFSPTQNSKRTVDTETSANKSDTMLTPRARQNKRKTETKDSDIEPKQMRVTRSKAKDGAAASERLTRSKTPVKTPKSVRFAMPNDIPFTKGETPKSGGRSGTPRKINRRRSTMMV